jgi:tetratricopeptide (TPR) repeat protein
MKQEELIGILYKTENVLEYISAVKTLGKIADVRSAVPILQTSYRWPIQHEQVRETCFQAIMKCCNENSLPACFKKMADILSSQRYYDGAYELYNRMRRMCVENNDKAGEADSIMGKANVLYAQENLDDSTAAYLEAENIYRAIGKKKELALCIGTRANVLYEKGELKAALALHEQAKEMFADIGDMKGIQNALANIAMIREDLKAI